MDEPYLPASDFLRMVADDEVALVGGAFADRNLKLLISFMSDEDVSNRDWATMLLAMQDIDTLEVRGALIAATNDDDVSVRGEALEGLAERSKEAALPLVLRELQRDECGYGTFQAASIIGDQSLLEPLRLWLANNSVSSLNADVEKAIEACGGGRTIR